MNKKFGKVAFGAYRVTVNSREHELALKMAIEEGVSLIDTSANYTDGDSEKLIGKVLSQVEHKPMIISKVGYIQGENLNILDQLQFAKKDLNEIVIINENLKHSIHPDFIEDQVKRSLERLQLDCLDCYLLHNPEYYLKAEGSTKKEYYARIKKAFIKMEELVDRGLIKFYGISSNTFVDPKDDHTSTDLDIVFGAARAIKMNNHFKYIQFPMNLLEMGSLERQFEGNHLLERAFQFGLTTIINRPLNCFTEHGLLRLAIYPLKEGYKDHSNADDLFNKCIEPLVIKWLEVREDDGDKLFDIPLMKQIQSIWYKQNSQDAVDHIFRSYFFPLVANIWGQDLSVEESQKFYDLYEHAIQYSLLNMNNRAIQFEEQAVDKGLLFESDKPLTHKVIEKYQSFGADYILVGMRNTAYVDDLKQFF